jgi:hypothetical protein
MKDTAIEKGIQDLFEPSNYICPECHGVLLQIEEGGGFRFRYHTGPAYSAWSLLKEGETGLRIRYRSRFVHLRSELCCCGKNHKKDKRYQKR